MIQLKVLFLSSILFFSSCAAPKDGLASALKGITVYVTAPDGHKLLTEQIPIEFSHYDPGIHSVIQVDSEKRYQKMEGFGASLTDASAWLIAKRMKTADQKTLMRNLFDPAGGIGLSFLRQPIGGSDFALQYYSFDDSPTEDPDLKNFSIDHDKEYILPLLRDAIQLNPNLQIMASPWSPPAWMKQNNSPRGGKLKGPSVYPAFARYLTQFIDSYQKEGVPIYAISVQNEPLFEPPYPGMLMSWQEQFDFTDHYLMPELKKGQVQAKVLAFDHNWDLASYPTELLRYQNSAILSDIGGVAFHCYGGDPSAMGSLHDKYPQLDFYLTECSDFMPQTVQESLSDIRWVVETLLIKSIRNWAKTVVRWNIALDQNYGPRVPETNCKNCLGLVEINANTGKVRYLRDYYALGHISKFVQPGAYRIESTHEMGALETVAFLNTDGTRVLIAYNASSGSRTFQVVDGDMVFKYSLNAGEVATFHWVTNFGLGGSHD